jgi:DNA end-binding protein Ku
MAKSHEIASFECAVCMRVDTETGKEVPNEDIVKNFKVDTDTYVEVTKEELENVALESTRTIDIDELVQREEIDPRYIIRPYYLRPDGKVGHDAFAVIRETIRNMNMVAIGRVVLASREHIVALDKGLMGTLLGYPYEVRDEKEYFDEIQDVKVTKDMLDLAKHIVNQKAGMFEPEKFEDHYEEALTELIIAKRSGKTIAAKPRPRGENVVDLMDALKKSIASAPLQRARSLARHQPGRRRCSRQSREKRRPRKRPRKSPRQSSTSPPSRHQAGHSGRCRRSSRTRLRSRPLLPSGRRRAEDPREQREGRARARADQPSPSSSRASRIRGWRRLRAEPTSPIPRSSSGPLFLHPPCNAVRILHGRSAFGAGNTWEGFEIAGASAFPPFSAPPLHNDARLGRGRSN